MSVRVRTKQRPIYKTPNEYVQPGLADDMLETLGGIDMATAVWIMTKLEMQALQCWYSHTNEEMNIEDLACMFGDNYPADRVEPLSFYAGPEKNYDTGLIGCQDHRFELITGTAMHFVLDAIMFRLSQKGYDIFKKLEIPL